MSDVELVIKIPEKAYNALTHTKFDANLVVDEMRKSIANGTPVDLEGLKRDMKALNCGYPYGLDYLLNCLDKRLGLTIIEKDEEGGRR